VRNEYYQRFRFFDSLPRILVESSKVHERHKDGGSHGEGDREAGRDARSHVAHSDGALGHEHDSHDARDKVLPRPVEADHVVVDGHEEDGGNEEDGEVGKLLADEVDIGAVGAGIVLAQKDGNFVAKNLKYLMN
jgi:hypothetical protein